MMIMVMSMIKPNECYNKIKQYNVIITLKTKKVQMYFDNYNDDRLIVICLFINKQRN